VKWPYRWGTAWTSAREPVAGRSPFPPPPRPLAVASPVLEVFPSFVSIRARSAALARRLVSRIVALVNFSSPSERSRLCQNSSRSPKRSEFFLSWDSPACTPLPFVFRCVHSGGLAPPSVRRCDPSNLVPPSWFRATSAVSSASALRVCCAPLPACGVRRVSRCRPVALRRSGRGTVPRDADSPFEEFPSSAAVSASLHPLPPCRFRPSCGHQLARLPGRPPFRRRGARGGDLPPTGGGGHHPPRWREAHRTGKRPPAVFQPRRARPGPPKRSRPPKRCVE